VIRLGVIAYLGALIVIVCVRLGAALFPPARIAESVTLTPSRLRRARLIARRPLRETFTFTVLTLPARTEKRLLPIFERPLLNVRAVRPATGQLTRTRTTPLLLILPRLDALNVHLRAA
jgi:hypothetical protein